MKKSTLFLFTLAQILCATTLSCCPFEFCPDDQRPFFEQYETKNSTVTETEKEEK